MNNKLLLAYYGDDFTGSTDALEFLSRAGAKTVLFIEPPTAEQLAKYDGLSAIGVAGRSRSMSPAEMEEELRPAFNALKEIGASHIHYKVCSTFDSSPGIGSIGKAIDIGSEIFDSYFVPLLVAAPALGRYCAFGNLFARMGIGSSGEIYRLDRHPSMRVHPSTPADESDLRLHLKKQTTKNIGLMDLLQIAQRHNDAKQQLKNMISEGSEIILFDCMYEEQLADIGRLLDNFSSDEKPLFSVGSSGVEMALGKFWTMKYLLQPNETWEEPIHYDQLLVISGSCSPVTSDQIKWALSNGFEQVAVDTDALINREDDTIISQTIEEGMNKLRKGKSLVIHTCMGNEDDRLKHATANHKDKNFAEVLGTALGKIAASIIEQSGVKRIVMAGGDTSSYAARAMGIESVEMIAPFAPGAPLCRAYAPGSSCDGIEINFKGGQVGRQDYFGMAREGKSIERVI